MILFGPLFLILPIWLIYLAIQAANKPRLTQIYYCLDCQHTVTYGANYCDNCGRPFTWPSTK